MAERTLTDADAEAVATAIITKSKELGCNCSFKPQERELLHTMAKYIPTESVPTLGKFVELIDKAEKEIGMWVIRIIFIFGGGGAVLVILVKAGVLRFGK